MMIYPVGKDLVQVLYNIHTGTVGGYCKVLTPCCVVVVVGCSNSLIFHPNNYGNMVLNQVWNRALLGSVLGTVLGTKLVGMGRLPPPSSLLLLRPPGSQKKKTVRSDASTLSPFLFWFHGTACTKG